MPGQVIELNPVSHITTGYVGQPGKRVFYLQASKGVQVASVILEKLQVEALAEGVEQFVQDLKSRHADLADPESHYRAEHMALKFPLDPLFRVGQIGLGYDEENDLVVLVATEILVEGREQDEASVLRLFASRAQMLEVAQHGHTIVKQGRALCPLCGQPMDNEGHFCPRRNGHRW